MSDIPDSAVVFVLFCHFAFVQLNLLTSSARMILRPFC